ncbi:MAG: MobF family relaxase [Acidimicrobiia bacterium]
MRFTITPLGSVGGRTVDQVVDDIVRYLNRPRPTPGPRPAPPDSSPGPSRYYSDGAEEPGRWLGDGAAASDLRGDVDPDDFAKVLAGRHPRTGARLLTARGSSGRRPTLGVGAETRRADDGELLYDEIDAAAALGVEADELERLFQGGIRVALGALGRPPRGRQRSEPAGSYLVPIVDSDGKRWVRDSELSRLERARATGPSRQEIEAGGSPEDLLPLADAARLAGVTARYLRGLARRWEKHRDEIERTVADGRPVKRAYVVAWRGTKGRWLVRRSDLADFVARRTTPAVRVGFDLTLTTEKSLGVLALLGDDATRDAVLRAITAGNDTALRWWEQRMVARVGGELVPVGGWTAASFRHLTSRALDPFPHHHNVVANTVAVDGGERRTLDSRTLYRLAVGASALATAEMRHQLSAQLGVTWRRSPSGGWEIDGIPQTVLREFSQRRNEIDEALAELEEAIGRTSTIDELRNVVAETRPAKQQADPTDLRNDWWRRARAHDFTPGALAACIDRQAPGPARPDVDQLLDRLAGPEGITAGGSVFTRGDVLAALVDAPTGPSGQEQPLLVGATELEEIADEFLASARVVPLRPVEGAPRLRGLGDEPVYMTREMLGVQQRIIDRFRRGMRGGGATGLVDDVAAVIAADGLSAEQAHLVRAFCSSGHRVQCAVGRAGTGKTTAMRAAADAWTRAGYRVLGAAVKGDAARQLGKAAGIPAETLAWYLAWDDPSRGPLDARTVLVVDEASTIGDRDLDRLLHLAEATGATVRLIGDPAQHGAVAAGGMFRVLCERHTGLTPELTENRRLLHAGDREAVDALRDGRIEEALAALQAAGHLHLAADDVQLYARLLTRWWDSRQRGAPHPLVERSNRRRRQLNRLARKLLQVHGEIATDELPASGGRAFSAGDQVMARRGNRHLHPDGDPAAYLRNGSRGTVSAVVRGKGGADDRLVVTFADLGTIEVPRSFFDDHPGPNGRVDAGIDHAYAVTSYAVQGATFEESTGRVDERTSRAETYVDLTRGRNANHLFVTRAEDPLDGERLPKAPAPPLDAALAIRLRASGAEVTAWELDPDALARATPAPAPSLV